MLLTTVSAGARENIMESDSKLLFILDTQRIISIKEEEEGMTSKTLDVRIVGKSDEETVLQEWS